MIHLYDSFAFVPKRDLEVGRVGVHSAPLPPPLCGTPRMQALLEDQFAVRVEANRSDAFMRRNAYGAVRVAVSQV